MASTVEQLVVELDARTAAFEQRLSTAEGSLGKLKRTATDTAKGLAAVGTAGLDAIDKRIALLAKGAQAEATRAASIQKLESAETQLKRSLEAGNLSLTERIRLQSSLAKAQGAIAGARGGGVVGDGFGAINQRIALLEKGAQIESTRSVSLQRLVAAEQQLQKVLASGTLTFAQRIKVEETLARTRTAIAGGVGPLVQAGQAANVLGQRYAGAALAISSAAESMARSGNVAGGAAKTLLASGGQIAFAFGPTGAIAGAVAITGLAIIEMFQRTRKEIEETRRKAVEEANKIADELDALQNKRDIGGLATRREAITRGTPARNFTDALATQEKQVAEFRRRTEEEIATLQQKAAGVSLTGTDQQFQAAVRRIAAIEAEIKRKREELSAEEGRLNSKLLEVNQIDARLAQLRQQPLTRDEEITSLSKLISLEAASNAELKRAAELAAELRKELSAIPATPQTADQRAGILERIKSLQPPKKDRPEGVDAVKALRQEFATLSASLTTSDPLDNIAAKFDALRAKAESLRGVPAATIGELTAEVERLRQAAIQVEQAKIDKIIDEMAIRESATLTDDLREKFDALLATLSKGAAGKPAFLARLEEIRQMADESVAAQGTVEALSEEIGKVKDRVGSGGIALVSSEQIDRLFDIRTALEAIVANEQVTAEVRERAKAQLTEINALIADAGSDLFKIPATTKDINRGLSATVDNLLHGAKAALQLAGAMGLVDERTAQALQSVVGLGVGIAKIIATKGKQGIPESIGEAFSLAGQIFGSSPAAKARADELKKNTEQLARLNRNVGHLVGSNIPGTQFSSAQRAIETLLRLTGTAGAHRRFGDEGPLRNIDPRRTLEGLGFDFDEIQAIADEFGIVLNGTKQSYIDLLAAIKGRDLEAFLDSFAGKLSQLEATLDIEGVTDPIERFVRRAELLAKTSPLFDEIFKGLDLSTIEGRAEAAKRLREQWEAFMKDPEQFRAALEASGLSLDEWREQMLEVNRELTEAAIAAQRFADALAGIDLDLEIAGIEDPVTRARAVAGAAAEADPRLQGVLGFNLGTAEGRAAAEKFLQGLAIGADPEFKQIIVELLRAIRDIPDAVGGEDRPGEVEIVGRGAQGLTEVTGNRMADFLRTTNIILRDIRNLLAGRLGDDDAPPTAGSAAPLIPPPPPPLAPPNIPPAARTAGGSVVQVTLTGDYNVNVPPGVVTNQSQLEDFLTRRMIERIRQGLADLAFEGERARGRTVIAG